MRDTFPAAIVMGASALARSALLSHVIYFTVPDPNQTRTEAAISGHEPFLLQNEIDHDHKTGSAAAEF